MSMPQTSALPLTTGAGSPASRPSSARPITLLPEPDSPTSASTSPGGTSMLTPRSACNGTPRRSKVTCRSCTLARGGGSSGPVGGPRGTMACAVMLMDEPSVPVWGCHSGVGVAPAQPQRVTALLRVRVNEIAPICDGQRAECETSAIPWRNLRFTARPGRRNLPLVHCRHDCRRGRKSQADVADQGRGGVGRREADRRCASTRYRRRGPRCRPPRVGRPEGCRGEGDREGGRLTGGGLSDVQGHLHRPAEAVPRPVRGRGAWPDHYLCAHARRLVRPCAGTRAFPAPSPCRD